MGMGSEDEVIASQSSVTDLEKLVSTDLEKLVSERSGGMGGMGMEVAQGGRR